MEQISELKKQKFYNLVYETNKYFYRNAEYDYRNYRYDDSNPVHSYCAYFKLPIAEKKEQEYRKSPLVETIFSIIYSNCRSNLSANVISFLSRKSKQDFRYLGFDNVYERKGGSFVSIYPTPGATLFWALFLCAVSEEFYDNELNLVADLATALDFSPADVEDWITAVKYVLDNNKLSEDCDLAVKGEAAKEFFGVKGITSEKDE